MDMRTVAVTVALSCLCVASLATETDTAEAERLCTDLEGQVVLECVAPALLALEYTDQYMRGVAMRPALAALEVRNAAIHYRRSAPAREAERKAEAARERECRRKGYGDGGVRLGMSMSDVLICGWGEPAQRSRRTDAGGVVETWVMPDHRTLVFRGTRVAVIYD